MKLDRRTFLSLGVGAAAGGAIGTNFTPMPWKLMDDSSIWSQNWPWTPVPADGEITYSETTCNLCPGGCGVKVRKVDDRAIKIEGIEGHPVNDGGICILGLSGLQLLYGPTKIQRPLKRAGKRGAGKWVPVTWNEALAEVAAKLADLRKAGKAHTAACALGDEKGTVPALFKRFMKAYGSANVISESTIWDTYNLAIKLMCGVDAQAGFDLENSDFVLSVGAGLIDGWGSPVRAFKANAAWRNNMGHDRTKVVQVEPRLSNTAGKADQWVAINPGTEAALMLGLCNVIVSETRFKRNFVEGFGGGFSDFTDGMGRRQKGFARLVIEEYKPEKVAKITGVDKHTIAELARSFASAKKPVAVFARGKGNTTGAVKDCMAALALNALVGNINRPGGLTLTPSTGEYAWPAIVQDTQSHAGLRRPRVDEAATPRYPLASQLPHRLAQALKKGNQGKINALLVFGGNPAFTVPDSEAFIKAMESIEFIVSFSSHMDETTAMADLILPDISGLEGVRDIPAPPGLAKPYMALTSRVVNPVTSSRHAGEVLIALAKQMGGSIGESFPWRNYEAALKDAVKDQWSALKKKGYWQDDKFVPAPWTEAFQTPMGKFEFCPQVTFGPREKKAVIHPRFDLAEAKGDAKALPLTMVPIETIRLTENAVGTPPFMIKAVEDTVLKKQDTVVEVNPKTAKAYGLKEGKSAVLTTPLGKAKVRIHLFEGIMPGLVGLPKGLGHTAYDDYLGGKGVNYNALAGPVEDPVTGNNAAWGIRAKLTLA